tara:strand:- start:167 stop:331 length:165 start_codon:yes stop_codon:yes gene_type:complete
MTKPKMPPQRSREAFKAFTGGEKKDPDRSISKAFESSAGKPSNAPTSGAVHTSM